MRATETVKGWGIIRNGAWPMRWSDGRVMMLPNQAAARKVAKNLKESIVSKSVRRITIHETAEWSGE